MSTSWSLLIPISPEAAHELPADALAGEVERRVRDVVDASIVVGTYWCAQLSAAPDLQARLPPPFPDRCVRWTPGRPAPNGTRQLYALVIGPTD